MHQHATAPMADDDVSAAEAKARAEAERRTEAARLRAAALNNFEAAHEAIWAQATAVVNVKALIPIILDKATNTYTKCVWHVPHRARQVRPYPARPRGRDTSRPPRLGPDGLCRLVMDFCHGFSPPSPASSSSRS